MTSERFSFRSAFSQQLSIPAPAAPAEAQVSFAAVAESEVIDKLRRAQVDTLSPIEALNLLYELKQKLE